MKGVGLSFLVAALSSVCLTAFGGWRIDEALRFQLAYVPDGGVSLPEDAFSVPSLGYFPDWQPDIDNIVLKDIRGLGFPLPERENPALFKLYLKLYDFPKGMDAEFVAREVLGAYHFADMPSAASLAAYASKGAHLAVKYGVIDLADVAFSPTHPFPAFRAAKGEEFQAEFVRHTPFFSLYLNPESVSSGGTEEERARASADGVLSFYEELLVHYRKTLQTVAGPEPDKFHYFFDKETKTSLRVPVRPFVFDNWRSLPMPSDPKKHFLTGLLLIYRSQASDSAHVLAPETVFEVASVVRL